MCVTLCILQDGSGHIDFREYVIGMSMISEPAGNEETVQLAFKLFDKQNKVLAQRLFQFPIANGFLSFFYCYGIPDFVQSYAGSTDCTSPIQICLLTISVSFT